MAKLFSNVKPGDLITADFMNGVLAAIQSLQDQVSQLVAAGPGGPPVINSVSPGPLHVGDTLTVVGQNFAPLSSTVVSIDGTTINQFDSGSGDSVLIFKIPTLFTSDQGTPMFLSVTTPRGSATTSVTIFPALPTIPDGTLTVSLIQSPNSIAAPSADFVFRATAILNMDETFDVTPSVDAGWPAVFVDAQKNPIVPSQILIKKAVSTAQPVTVDIPVRVTIPNTPGASGKLSLKIVSQRNPTNPRLSQSSGQYTLTVGGTPPVVSDKIRPSVAFSGTTGNWDGTTVLVPPTGQPVAVPFSVFFVNHGDYAIKIALPTNDPNKLWDVKLFTSPNLSPQQDNSLLTGIAVTVSAKPGAPNSSFIFRVESKLDPQNTATELPVPIKLKT